MTAAPLPLSTCHRCIAPNPSPVSRYSSPATTNHDHIYTKSKVEVKEKKKHLGAAVVAAAAAMSHSDRTSSSGGGDKEKEAREKREEVNCRIASKKAISIILRREAAKAIIEKKGSSTNSKKLLPRTVLEALHERIGALRWESALKVLSFFVPLLFHLLTFI